MDGEMLWQYQIDQENSMDDRLYDIYEMTSCANDDFLICGEFQTGDKNEAGLIMRFNKEGELLWERHYRAYDDFGGQRDCYLEAVREMPDGSIVGIGSMQQESFFGAEEDFWILKVGADGCYRGGDCDDVNLNQWLTSTEEISDKPLLALYPNPVTDILNIESQEMIVQTVISAPDGRLLSTQRHADTNITLDINLLEQGMYYLNVVTHGHEEIRSFIKQ